jgi:hypothetical protein
VQLPLERCGGRWYCRTECHRCQHSIPGRSERGSKVTRIGNGPPEGASAAVESPIDVKPAAPRLWGQVRASVVSWRSAHSRTTEWASAR